MKTRRLPKKRRQGANAFEERKQTALEQLRTDLRWAMQCIVALENRIKDLEKIEKAGPDPARILHAMARVLGRALVPEPTCKQAIDGGCDCKRVRS